MAAAVAASAAAAAAAAAAAREDLWGAQMGSAGWRAKTDGGAQKGDPLTVASLVKTGEDPSSKSVPSLIRLGRVFA